MTRESLTRHGRNSDPICFHFIPVNLAPFFLFLFPTNDIQKVSVSLDSAGFRPPLPSLPPLAP